MFAPGDLTPLTEFVIWVSYAAIVVTAALAIGIIVELMKKE